MSYKALYRNYRPQIFSDIAGQEHIVTTLKNAIKLNKVSHAYLFTGPRGTGKTTIAKLLAKAVNCNSESKPCGICPSCLSTKDGRHPDVIEIDAASNNGVDEVRDLIDKVKYSPIEGNYKIYIIDEVHMMTSGAFNALLKTLEEPPKHALFILATTEPHKILPTIISRCQRFDFKKVSESDILSRMQIVLDEEGKSYDNETLVKISKLADGGMRDALSILEQCLAYDNELKLSSVELIYGLLSNENKMDFIKRIINKDIKEVLSILDNLLSTGKDIKTLTTEIIDILKDCIIYKNTNDISLLFHLTQEEVDQLVPYITIDEVFGMIDTFIEATLQYPKAVDVRIYFEVAVIKLCNNVQYKNTIESSNKEIIKTKEIDEVKIPASQPVSKTDEINITNLPETSNSVGDNTFMKKITEIQKDDSINIDNLKTETELEVNSSVNNDDIFNILVQANKDTFVEIKEKWSVIPKYKFHLNTARYASVLENGTPVAACKGAIIISYEHLPQVLVANDESTYHDIRNFLKELLGQEFDFIAVLHTEWLTIRNKFVELKTNNNLPVARELTFKHIKEYVAPVIEYSEAKQHALDMFGKDIVEFKD